MARVNRYFRDSKLSEVRFRHLVRCFALDLTATQTAELTGIPVRSVNSIFLRMRRKIAAECERESLLEGVFEADESYFGPRRVSGKHREDEFARQTHHINGIESFWSLAKRRLARFCGVPRHTFYLHLKETEFRFNHRRQNLYRILLHCLRKDPL